MKKVATITLDDVAKLAKVSRATVSRVINTPDQVSSEVVERTNLAIKQLRYTPNRFARALTVGRTNSIGLVFFEDVRTMFTNPFWGDVLNALYENLAANNLSCNLIAQSSSLPLAADSNLDMYENFLSQGNSDGYIFFGQYPELIEKKFGLAHMPIVIFGKPFYNNSEFSYVDTDNVGGATKAVNYLANKGKTRIATITGPTESGGGFDRYLGYKNGLVENHLKYDPNLVAFGEWTKDSGTRAMNEIFSKTQDIDAIFVASDLMAVGAMQAIQDRGLRVPQDIALIAFDNSSLAVMSRPSMTSVEQPFDKIGEELVKAVLKAIEGISHQSRVLGTEIIERESG